MFHLGSLCRPAQQGPAGQSQALAGAGRAGGGEAERCLACPSLPRCCPTAPAHSLFTGVLGLHRLQKYHCLTVPLQTSGTFGPTHLGGLNISFIPSTLPVPVLLKNGSFTEVSLFETSGMNSIFWWESNNKQNRERTAVFQTHVTREEINLLSHHLSGVFFWCHV